MKKITAVLLAALCITGVLTSCGGDNGEKLVGAWVATDADNQKLEILTEEIRFNYRRFSYTVEKDVIHLSETYPNQSIIGDMPYELDGDLLRIDLGTEFEGYFYGRSGTVYLERR